MVFASLSGMLGLGLTACGSGYHGSFTTTPVTVVVSGATQARVGDTVAFTAAVSGTANSAVTWQVNQIAGGNASFGTISATGSYSAPAVLPSPTSVVITAVSAADATASGSLALSLLNPVPTLTSATATQTGANGAVLVDVMGSRFVSGAQVFVGAVAQTTQFVSAGELTASFTPAAGVTSVTVTVVNPSSGAVASNALTVAIPQITVTVSGAAQTRIGQTTQFTAVVANVSNQAVTWQVNGVVGGAAATGTISASGLFVAPATLPSANPVTITAVSQAVASASGSAQETIWNAVPAIASATAVPTGSAGALLLDVVGSGFAAGAQITLDGGALTTQFVSQGELKATFTPAAGKTSAAVVVGNPNPGAANSNTYTLQIPAITVTVSGAAQTRIGQTTQFTATVSNTSNTAVSWSVNGVAGGSAGTGTISSTGLYTAPASVPAGGSVTITATSQQDVTASGSETEAVWNAVPVISSATTAPTGGSGALLLDVLGSGFAAGAQILVDGTALSTQYVSQGELKATFTPAAGKTSVAVVVANPNPGAANSNTYTLQIAAITVTVSGAAQTRIGLTTQFTAVVTNTSNTAVSWSVNSVAGGSAAAGTITSAGLYTAPASVPAGGGVTITATSQQDSTASGSMTEAIWNPVPVATSGTVTPTGSAGALLLDVVGSGYVSGAQILINGVAQVTTFVSATELTTTFVPANGATSIAVAVTNPNPGSATSNTITVGLTQITVTVSGAAQTVVSGTAQMTATVTGTSNQSVTWAVNGVVGGAVATGTISASGLFTAPGALPTGNPVTITATSQQDTSKSGSLAETILNAVPTISSVVPKLTSAAGVVALDVVGTNFAGGASIQVAASGLNTTVVKATEVQGNYTLSSAQMQALFNASPTAQTITVTVVNPGPGGGTSNAVTVSLPSIYVYTGAFPSDEVASPYFVSSVGGVPQFVHTAAVRMINFYQFLSKFTGGAYDPYPPGMNNVGKASFASVQLNGGADVVIGFPAGYPKSGAITSSSQVKILPTGAIDPTTISVVNNTVRFAVTGIVTPQQLVVEIDGDYLNSFELFVNPFETWPKNATQMQPGFITQGTIDSLPAPYHFGPGEYIVNGNIGFRRTADIYLEDGAIIKWYPAATGGPMLTMGGNPANASINMVMHGSGIIDGTGQENLEANGACGYGSSPLTMNNLTVTPTTKVGVDGIILRNACAFTLPVSSVRGLPGNHAFINNVKIMGATAQTPSAQGGNPDGIDILVDQYFDITHSFIRTDDDLVAVDQTSAPSSAYSTYGITVTNNIFWNELAHAMVLCCINPSSDPNDTAGVDNVLFDHNTVIHDTGKATVMGVESGYHGLVKNVTFSNITVEEDRALITINTGPDYGDTAVPAIVQGVTFTNINQLTPQVTQTIGTYITPVPNIQLLVQTPYGNNYVGNGTTSGSSPAVLQGPFNFNNVMVNGSLVTQYTDAPGFTNTASIPIPENVVVRTMLQRTQSTYGPFVYQPQQIPLDIFPPFCNGVLCPFHQY